MAKKRKSAAATASLLVELLTEELPPGSLDALGNTFTSALAAELDKLGLLDGRNTATAFATPRRIAALITRVRRRAPDQIQDVRGPAVAAGLDSDGNPTRALTGFAGARGVDIGRLTRQQTERGEFFYCREKIRGARLADVLPDAVASALRRLPARKLMRWGDGDAEFVRPVHGLVMLHGSSVIRGTVLGRNSGNRTQGHRFLSTGPILIRDADGYEKTMKSRGRVIVSFESRRARIADALESAAATRRADVFPVTRRRGKTAADARLAHRMRVARDILRTNAALLDEVTAMVEWPCVYAGRFEKEFLKVPAECISLTMQKNQRYFALTGRNGDLLPDYLIVSNMETKRPAAIIDGNARVLRARLADARFFLEQDLKTPLADLVPGLGRVVYHNRLGTQLERVERLRDLAGRIARMVEADAALAERAAWLCKADLLSNMVGEFPELQGIMGAHYAAHWNERPEVAAAIEGHYRPRFAGDEIAGIAPLTACVALADKLESLAGLFGIGQQPGGDKDPFGLRRAAIGIVRILIEMDLPLNLKELVAAAFASFTGGATDARAELETFIFERLASHMRESGYTALEVDAVMCLRPAMIHQVPRRLEAVRAFAAMPEAESLAAANKRVGNILRQAASKGESFTGPAQALLAEAEERTLFDALTGTERRADALFDDNDFTGYLRSFAVLKTPVDAFFDKVMVMADDPALRGNRLALLQRLQRAMNRVADISRLAA